MKGQGEIERLIGWHLLIAPRPCRTLFFEGTPTGVDVVWNSLRGETVVDNPVKADVRLYWNQTPPVEPGAEGWVSLGPGQSNRPINARRYALIPPNNPRLVLPLDNRKQLKRGLAMHRPGRWVARLAVYFLSHLVSLGITRPLARRVLWIDGKLPTNDMVGSDAVLYLGTADDCRKTTILPANDNQILKHGSGKDAMQALRAEASALEALVETHVADRVPKLLSFEEGAAESLLTQEYRARKRCSSKVFEAEIVRFLVDIACTKTETRGGIPGHRCHGDFAPWNVIMTEGGLFVFDWEESLDWAPALSDAFYFVVAPFIHVVGRSSTSKVAARALNLGLRIAKETGLPSNAVPKLWHDWLTARQDVVPCMLVSEMLANCKEL